MKKLCLLFFSLAVIFLTHTALAVKPTESKTTKQPTLAVPPTNPTPVEQFTPEQIKAIEEIAHNYIVNHPQVLIEAGKKLQEAEALKEKMKIDQINALIPKYKEQIFDTKAPSRVVLGNPNGKIIVAEFTQHQCPSCKLAAPIAKNLLKKYPDMKLIIIYWPFFGEHAIYSAKVAIAAHQQNQFEKLDRALSAREDFVNKTKVDNIIKSELKINSKKLYSDMENKEFDRGLMENTKLARELGLIGTPSFIFTNKEMTKFSFVPGLSPEFEADLNRAIEEVKN